MKEHSLEGGPDEINNNKVIDPPPTQGQNIEEIEEVLDLEEEEDSTIPMINDHDAQHDQGTGVTLENDNGGRITGVCGGNRTRVRNCIYFNPDIINAMITKKELSKVHFEKSKDLKPACKEDIMTGVLNMY